MRDKNILKLVILTLAFSFVLSGCVGIFNKKDSKDAKVTTPGQVAILDSNVVINTPLSNQTVSSPVEISGRARVFEGLVLFRVRNAQNVIITTSSMETGVGAPEWGAYSKSLEYPQPNTPTGFVEVYAESAKDGSDQDLISLPVTFGDFKNPVMSMYFSNTIEDPELLNCDVVYSVQREIPFSNNVLGGLLSMLFNGVTEEEAEQGFVNNLPLQGVELVSMSLATTTLTLDFNQGLQEGVSGECQTAAIRSQIIQTMKQIDGIDDVIISIEGQTEDILQP